MAYSFTITASRRAIPAKQTMWRSTRAPKQPRRPSQHAPAASSVLAVLDTCSFCAMKSATDTGPPSSSAALTPNDELLRALPCDVRRRWDRSDPRRPSASSWAALALLSLSNARAIESAALSIVAYLHTIAPRQHTSRNKPWRGARQTLAIGVSGTMLEAGSPETVLTVPP